jgi:hypothetical protein
VPFADLLLQEAPTCPEAVQAEHLVFLLLLHGFYSSKHTARKTGSFKPLKGQDCVW